MPEFTLRVDVAAMPTEVDDSWSDKVCIVIDVLRASSTIVTLFDHGCDRVYTAASVDGARALAEATGSLTGGERGGLPLPGFDFGNSPRELDLLELKGASAVLTTTNGTRAIDRVKTARAVLAGCFLNATACTSEALRIAQAERCSIGIVCAAREHRLALDDLYCAGHLLHRLAAAAGQTASMEFESDTARLAFDLNAQYRDAAALLRETASGRALSGIGLGLDIERCASVDISDTVPVLSTRDPACFIAARWRGDRDRV